MTRGADPLERLRRVCLAFPETREQETWQTPTFRVRKKIFAMYVEDPEYGGATLWCKATFESQAALIEADPERFFSPPYVGVRGWLGVRLAGALAWDFVEELVEEAYRATAPKRLAGALPRGPAASGADSDSTRARRAGSGRRRSGGSSRRR